MSIKVGQDIESICGKCGDVWHVVVAMKGSSIAKVQCKQCSGYHRYRPPGGLARSRSSVASPGAARSPATSSSKRARRSKASATPLVEPDLSQPIRRYAISESFAVGDRITHPTFGDGIVEVVLEDRKVQVFFDSGRRVMAHQR